MPVVWNKLADVSELNMRNARHNLYLHSENGIRAEGLSMLRPAPLTTNYDHPPLLHFSSNDSSNFSTGAFDNDIKFYNMAGWGESTSGSDTTAAYIAMPGDRSLSGDGTGVTDDDNDNLIEDFMGCTFAVPLGDENYAQHDFDASVIVSQESDYVATHNPARIAFTLWRAYTSTNFTIDSSTNLPFLLVKRCMKGFGDSDLELPDQSNSMKHFTFDKFSLPLANTTAGDNWGAKMCHYMVGCWILNPSTGPEYNLPQTNGVGWPQEGSNGSQGACSIKMSLNVAYRSPYSYVS